MTNHTDTSRSGDLVARLLDRIEILETALWRITSETSEGHIDDIAREALETTHG